MLEQFGEPVFVYLTFCCQYPVAVHFAQSPLFHKVIDRRIGWTGIECHKCVITIPPGDVTDTTEIENRSIATRIGTAQQGSMIDGRKRSTLPASTNICRPEIISHFSSEQLAHKPSIAKLPCITKPACLRCTMQNRLPVETDNADIRHRQPAFLNQFAHSRRLGACQRFLCLSKNRRFRTFKIPDASLGLRLFEKITNPTRIRFQRVSAEFRNGFAISFQQGNIDVSIKNGTGHQANGPYWLHRRLLSQ